MTKKVYLIHAKVKRRSSWYYVQANPLKAPLLEKMIAQGTGGNLAQFGEILASGWGDRPPEALRARFGSAGGL